MRKKIFGIATICLVVILVVFAVLRIKRDNNTDNGLKKVKVADTTLTSRTYINKKN